MQLLYMLSLHPPLVCLLCACSDLISSQHRQGQDRDRRNTRGKNVGIAIPKSSPPPKASNSKVPTSKGSQKYPKTHLTVSSLHSCATETPREVSTVESAFHYPDVPTTPEQQWQAQNSIHSTPIPPTSILINSILLSCQTNISSVLSCILSRNFHHLVPMPPNSTFTQEISRTSQMIMNLINFP